MASFDRDSFDTLSSIESDCSSPREGCSPNRIDCFDSELYGSSQGSYDETKTVDTLEADIILWEAQAALYAQDSIIWPPTQPDIDSESYWVSFGDQEGNTESNDEKVNRIIVEQELHLLQTTSSQLKSKYTQNIYLNESPFFERVGDTVQAKALSMDEYLELRKSPWFDDYINILVTDEFLFETEVEESQAQEEAGPKRMIGFSDKSIKKFQSKRGRKDRKRKFAHKTEDSRGKIIEAPKQISKKPYPTWRKKKTGRAHKEALVPRDKDEHLKEVFEVCKIDYPKNAPWDSNNGWEEAGIKLWNGPSVMTTYKGTKELWL